MCKLTVLLYCLCCKKQINRSPDGEYYKPCHCKVRQITIISKLCNICKDECSDLESNVCCEEGILPQIIILFPTRDKKYVMFFNKLHFSNDGNHYCIHANRFPECFIEVFDEM